MSEFTISVKIEADSKDAQRAVEGLEKALKELDKTLKDT